MIRVSRGVEPASPAPVRDSRLATLRAVGRPPVSTDIDGYQVVAKDLWSRKHCKCCYCEARIQLAYNDVEHYRPKTEADRTPGCVRKHGYWWLAYTWDNLLFACPSSNRSGKNVRFPLAAGATSLTDEKMPPGRELPLLIDPGSFIDPVAHIVFVYKRRTPTSGSSEWFAEPRGGSVLGAYTIEVCKLNRDELIELRRLHFETAVEPIVEELETALNINDQDALFLAHKRATALFKPKNVHVGLAYDALRARTKNARLHASLGAKWPPPSKVGI